MAQQKFITTGIAGSFVSSVDNKETCFDYNDGSLCIYLDNINDAVAVINFISARAENATANLDVAQCNVPESKPVESATTSVSESAVEGDESTVDIEAHNLDELIQALLDNGCEPNELYSTISDVCYDKFDFLKYTDKGALPGLIEKYLANNGKATNALSTEILGGFTKIRDLIRYLKFDCKLSSDVVVKVFDDNVSVLPLLQPFIANKAVLLNRVGKTYATIDS